MGARDQRVAAIVVGGGAGTRLVESSGEAQLPPKALVSVAGRPLISWSLRALLASRTVMSVLPVLPAESLGAWAEIASEFSSLPGLSTPVAGGGTRQESVAAGLAALSPGAAYVAVHDAARPLIAPDAIDRVVETALAHGAAILAAPVSDTIKLVSEGAIASTPPRPHCYAAQTPQVFRVDWLREAHEKAAAEGYTGTDDAELVERLGVPVRVVTGDPRNRKVTDAEDLAWVEARLRQGAP